MPALLKAKSSRPNCSIVRSTRFLTCDCLGDIGRHEDGFASLGPDELNGLFAFGGSAAGHNHLGPFPGIGDGGGAADS